jgi:hypothetical protein
VSPHQKSHFAPQYDNRIIIGVERYPGALMTLECAFRLLQMMPAHAVKSFLFGFSMGVEQSRSGTVGNRETANR